MSLQPALFFSFLFIALRVADDTEAMVKNKTTTKYLYFNSRDELYRVNISSIVYFEADGNYTTFVLCNNKRGTVNINLLRMQNFIKETLTEQGSIFARIGKKYIVNLSYVFHINTIKQTLTLSDGQLFCHDIELSKDALKKLKELFVSKEHQPETETSTNK